MVGGDAAGVGPGVDVVGSELQVLPDGTPAKVALSIGANRVFYLAAAHRSPLRSLTVDNLSLPDPETDDTRLVVTCRLESAAGSGFLLPVASEIPLPPKGIPARFNSLTMDPNRDALSRLEERLEASIVAEATFDGELVGHARWPLELLAHNQWMHRPEYWDTLAAFVLPNCAVLDPVITAARGWLQEHTGSSSTEGYQSQKTNPARVHEMAEAIYVALQACGLDYTNPPPSFEGVGQKVRTPEDVFRERAATCLDSAVLYAACLQRVGLQAQVVMVDRHAFTTYLTRTFLSQLDDPSLSAAVGELNMPVCTNRNAIALLRQGGLLQPVETTKFTTSRTTSFAEACNASDEYFGASLNELQGIVNISAAVNMGVTPLPTQQSSAPDAGVAPTVQPWVEAASVDALVVGNHAGRAHLQAVEAPPRVQSWMRSLLDLTFANPLLRMRKDGRGATALPFDLPAGVASTVEDRLMQGSPLTVVPATRAPAGLRAAAGDPELYRKAIERSGEIFYPNLTDVDRLIEQNTASESARLPDLPAAQVRLLVTDAWDADWQSEIERRIKALKRKADDLERQTGTNNLFLCIGELQWTGDDAKGGLAPLFLVPVRLKGTARDGFRIYLDETGEPMPNQCLVEKLRDTYGITVAALEQPVLDDDGIDVDALVAGVRAALAGERVTDAVVTESVSLAVLNFSSFRLWRDLRDHWELFMEQPVFKHLVTTPGQSFADPNGEAALPNVLCPELHDASQLEAVRWAVSGRSFVLEGPPGTGKSQTITNLLAASIAAGKKVLFVAEKSTALDVVRKRLRDVGLGPLCLELFDKDAKPAAIAGQVKDALDLNPPNRDTEWQDAVAVAGATNALLDGYRDGLHEPGPLGLSAWAANEELRRLGEGPALPVPETALPLLSQHEQSVRSALVDLPRRVPEGRVVPSAWSLCANPKFESLERARLADAFQRLRWSRSVLHAQDPELLQLVVAETDPGTFGSIADAIDLATAGGGLTDIELEAVGTPQWTVDTNAVLERTSRFRSAAAELFTFFRPEILSADLSQQLAAGEAALVAGALARRKAERTLQASVVHFLATPAEPSAADLVARLRQVEPLRAEWGAVHHALLAVPGLRLPADFSVFDDAHLSAVWARVAALPAEVAAASHPIPRLLVRRAAVGHPLPANLARAFREAGYGWGVVLDMLSVESWSADLWLAGRTFATAWGQSEAEWGAAGDRFQALQRWCDVIEGVAPLRSAGLDEAADAVLRGEVFVDDALTMYRRGVAALALDERRRTARLDIFDAQRHDRLVEDYEQQFHARRKMMVERIPAELVRQRPMEPGQRVGVWGDLERQLGSRRRGLSIRSLMERYGEHVAELTPCFLMSPDSVARFLPPGSVTFDLVVFDEASQIEVPRSAGALGRSRAAVVVGDSKQMPPSKFGGTAVADDTESDGTDDSVVDLESLLDECRESNLPALALHCHYRSRHEALIAFSNRHFYEGGLITFPPPSAAGTSPITWHRVDGQFRSQGMSVPDHSSYNGDEWPIGTNRVEAEAVVAEIVKRVRQWEADNPDSTDPGPSIGVVTSNIQQRDLVRTLLENTGDQRIVALLDRDDSQSLLVQNLESVQGDERDVFLMSIGFAPKVTTAADGTLVRGRLNMNFGPLTRRGGERRLNVAVTRAREEVVVFCSFEPEEMTVTESSAKGVQLLRAYLAAARDGAHRAADVVGRAPGIPSLHRREIATALTAAGLKVVEDVGLSSFRVDLAVARPGDDDWKLAVLLDGPDWADRPNAHDRDLLPPAVLSLMEWGGVIRVWAPAWIDDPDTVVSNVVEALERAERAERTPSPFPVEPDSSDTAQVADQPTSSAIDGTDPPASDVPASTEPALVASAAPSTTPAPTAPAFGDGAPQFLVPDFPQAGDRTVLDTLFDPSSRAVVLSTLLETLDAVGPVDLEDLCKLTARRFDLVSVRAERIDAIVGLLPPERLRDSPLGRFAWPAAIDPTTWTGYRRTIDLANRSIATTPPEEVLNAARAYIQVGVEIRGDELLETLARFFGHQRITASVRSRINQVLDWAVSNGWVSRTDSGSYRLP